MYKVCWTPELETGIPQLDEGHRILIDEFNDLVTSTTLSKDTQGSSFIKYAKLIEDFKEHFTFEENLMYGSSYPGYRRHKRIHQGLMDEISDSYQYLRLNQMEVPTRTLVILKDWILDHIIEEDVPLGTWLKNK